MGEQSEIHHQQNHCCEVSRRVYFYFDRFFYKLRTFISKNSIFSDQNWNDWYGLSAKNFHRRHKKFTERRNSCFNRAITMFRSQFHPDSIQCNTNMMIRYSSIVVHDAILDIFLDDKVTNDECQYHWHQIWFQFFSSLETNITILISIDFLMILLLIF